jgi:hypothetical protein
MKKSNTTNNLEQLFESKLGPTWRNDVCYWMHWSRPKLKYTMEQPSKFITIDDLVILAKSSGISKNAILKTIYQQESY